MVMAMVAFWGCGGTPPPPRLGRPLVVDGWSGQVFVAAPEGKKDLPLILHLPGEIEATGRADFEALAARFVPRGYAVVTVLGPSGSSSCLEDSWKERVRGVARVLKAMRARGADLRRLAMVASAEDRWLAAHLASRLRSAVRVLVLVGAPPATLLDGQLSEGTRGDARAREEGTVRRAALSASAAHPYRGASARWWKDRLERAFPLEMKGVTAPAVVIHGTGGRAARRRIEFLLRSLRITGGPTVEVEALEGLGEGLRDGAGRRRFDPVVDRAFSHLWKHCPPLSSPSK